MKLEKIILYPDDDVFDDVRDFYHEKLGLEYIGEPTKWWVEFETGSIPIGLHHNGCFDDPYGSVVKRQFLAFTIDDLNELQTLYNRLEKDFDVADTVYSTDTHRLGALKENDECFLFLVRDPMGNDVRFVATK